MPVADLVRRATRRLGFDVVRYRAVPGDFQPADAALVEFVRPYTMTSPERVFALANAVRQVVDEKLDGAVVECGVWRGGSMMAVARTLLERGVSDRELYLFDTYEGMTAPTDEDRDFRGRSAAEVFDATRTGEDSADWCRAGVADVRANLARTEYPQERLHFVQGKVEETIPEHAPDTIALLRLDTDWYRSTKHEMEHLWPRLASGGICIVDDYGHWAGSRQAVDEYFAAHDIRVMLHRVDNTARLVVKP
jgi:O-methyltransferase